MNKKVIKFGWTEIEEYKFHHNKISFSINDVDVNEIDFEYFIGYKHSEKVRPLCIFHSQMIIY